MIHTDTEKYIVMTKKKALYFESDTAEMFGTHNMERRIGDFKFTGHIASKKEKEGNLA